MERNRTLVEGMIAGFLGYVVVAAWFATLNVALGYSPFHTAYALGAAFGAGWPGPGEAAGIVLAANGVHLVVSLLVGLAGAWVVREVEQYHDLWFAGVLALAGGILVLVVAAGVVGVEITAVTTWPAAAVASLLYALAVGGYFWATHRKLIHDLAVEVEP